jgi:basic membrane lipoprotein Med (substrate-binding protein (PBP1-ABC) superfamily)
MFPECFLFVQLKEFPRVEVALFWTTHSHMLPFRAVFTIRCDGALLYRTAHLALLDYPNSTTKFILSGGIFQPNEPNVGRCFPKLYECRYLSGMIAGRMTKTNVIGYVGSFPLPMIIRQANAFALGVRKVRWLPVGSF